MCLKNLTVLSKNDVCCRNRGILLQSGQQNWPQIEETTEFTLKAFFLGIGSGNEHFLKGNFFVKHKTDMIKVIVFQDETLYLKQNSQGTTQAIIMHNRIDTFNEQLKSQNSSYNYRHNKQTLKI